MKILLVNKFLYPKGGAETYILKLGDILRSCGHAVQYFVTHTVSLFAAGLPQAKQGRNQRGQCAT